MALALGRVLRGRRSGTMHPRRWLLIVMTVGLVAPPVSGRPFDVAPSRPIGCASAWCSGQRQRLQGRRAVQRLEAYLLPRRFARRRCRFFSDNRGEVTCSSIARSGERWCAAPTCARRPCSPAPTSSARIRATRAPEAASASSRDSDLLEELAQELNAGSLLVESARCANAEQGAGRCVVVNRRPAASASTRVYRRHPRSHLPWLDLREVQASTMACR
jgi:hypothetical protein